MAETPVYNTREEVDFVIIGSGAAGGIIAKELSTAGFSTVVLEQGKYRKVPEFTHDEIRYFLNGEWFGKGPSESGMTFRDDESNDAVSGRRDPAAYARTVGGSSVIFSAHFWRMRPIDFNERSVLGSIEGTNFADWPITYEELEPYYSKVEWDMGISGAPGPFGSTSIPAVPDAAAANQFVRCLDDERCCGPGPACRRTGACDTLAGAQWPCTL